MTARDKAVLGRYQACSICRRRKIKCDSVKPKCSLCARLGHECVYDLERQRKTSTSSSATSAPKSLPKPKHEATPFVAPAAAPIAATGSSNGLVDPWLSNFASIPGDTIPDTFSDATAFTDIWSDLFQFQNAPVTPGFSMDFDFNTMLPEPLFNQPSTFPLDPEIPSIDTQRTLLRVYFERIYPGAPFVHKDRLLASFESDNQPNPALLYIIYAMAVCQTGQVPEDIVSVYPATFFQSRALWHVQRNLAELKDLFQTVQALAFLTVFETGLSKRANAMHAYLLSGQALRISVMLGLHLLDKTYDESLMHPVRHAFPSLLPSPKSYDELEERRRTFWMVQICATMTSVQTLWPACALAPNEIYTCRPSNDEGYGQIRPADFVPPAASGAGWFSRLIEVAGLISRARDFLVQFQHGRRSADTSDNTIEQLERDLHNYQLTVSMDNLLPIRDNKDFDKSKVVYLLLSYVPTLFLHLPRSHYENPRCPHWLRCLDVAQKAMPIIQLCSMAPDITGLNSLSCFPLYMIGVVWLQEWRLRGDLMGLLRNSIESCSMVLQKLSERWASADRYLAKLRRDAANLPLSNECVNAPTLCPCMHPGLENEGLVRISILQNLFEAIKIYGGESPERE